MTDLSLGGTNEIMGEEVREREGGRERGDGLRQKYKSIITCL